MDVKTSQPENDSVSSEPTNQDFDLAKKVDGSSLMFSGRKTTGNLKGKSEPQAPYAKKHVAKKKSSVLVKLTPPEIANLSDTSIPLMLSLVKKYFYLVEELYPSTQIQNPELGLRSKFEKRKLLFANYLAS